MKRFEELVKDRGALDPTQGVGQRGMRVKRVRHAGTGWGADALSRSNYKCLVEDFGGEPWAAVDPDDGPHYIYARYNDDGRRISAGHYDETPAWDDGVLPYRALVFHDGEVYVNLSFEYDEEDEELESGLCHFADVLDGLGDYPVYNEEDFRNLEYEEALESLDCYTYDVEILLYATHEYAQEALELDPEFKVTGDRIDEALRALDIQWETESSSDGRATAYLRDDDLKRVSEWLAPPWLRAAADGLKWADLGYPEQPDPGEPVRDEYTSPTLPSTEGLTADQVKNWWMGGKDVAGS